MERIINTICPQRVHNPEGLLAFIEEKIGWDSLTSLQNDPSDGTHHSRSERGTNLLPDLRTTNTSSCLRNPRPQIPRTLPANGPSSLVGKREGGRRFPLATYNSQPINYPLQQFPQRKSANLISFNWWMPTRRRASLTSASNANY